MTVRILATGAPRRIHRQIMLALACLVVPVPRMPAAEVAAIKVEESADAIVITTDKLEAKVNKKGYVSGVAAGGLLDKSTGTRDRGFGLHIMDFLLAPGWKDDGYPRDKMLHGDLPKHYVEGPQICTQAKELKPTIIRGKDFVAIELTYRFKNAASGLKAGSEWKQTLLFLPGVRYFLSSEEITSVNDLPSVSYRIDMPGHIRTSQDGDFSQIYLSYEGKVPRNEFLKDFAPDAKHFYQRREGRIPKRMIRAYQIVKAGKPGPWLAGMTLDPEITSEAWCHQRGYVCFIQELHGKAVKAGEPFGAAYVVGYFEDIAAMEKTCDKNKGAKKLMVTKDKWELK